MGGVVRGLEGGVEETWIHIVCGKMNAMVCSFFKSENFVLVSI